MIDRTYFVYEHRQVDTGSPFYVGKGTSLERGDYRRAFDRWRRLRMWKSVAAKHGVEISVVAEFFSEPDALAFEVELIAKYGRRDKGTGTLVNHTDGGMGMSGYKLKPETIAKIIAYNTGRITSEVTKAKISAASSGELHWKYGTTESSETRLKKADSMRGKNIAGRIVIDRSTGRLFASVLEAARHLEMPGRTLSNYLSGQRHNKTTMEFSI